MGKQTFDKTKTMLGILLLVFFVISVTATAVSACTSTPATSVSVSECTATPATSVSVSADNSKAQCKGDTSKQMNMAAPEEVNTTPSKEVNMKVAPEKGTCAGKGSAMTPEPVKSDC
jgi:hypothetical protein